MRIQDHRLSGESVKWIASPRAQSARIEPSLIVLHDTAGALRTGSSVEWFKSPECKTSVHFVIERDGSIAQMVDCDRKADHAGESSWKGRKYCNGFSLGIEMVNPGKLKAPNDDGVCRPEGFKTLFPVGMFGIVEAESKACGKGWWMPYTPAQLTALDELLRVLVETYPSITEIVGHHDVSPGRKIDPCPLMPWDRVRQALGSRKTYDVEAIKDVQSRLSGLGYHLGTPDGFWGPRTRSALRDFQEQNGLPVTGKYDEATNAVLMSGEAKEMVTGSRDEWTAKDIVAQGSTQAKVGVKAKIAGVAAQATAAAMVLGEAAIDDVAEVATQATKIDPEATIGLVERSVSLLGKVGVPIAKVLDSPLLPLGLALAAVGGISWVVGRAILTARLRAAKSGQHTGI